MTDRVRVLLLGHYPLWRLDRAPAVRTWNMAQGFARVAEVTVITGTRRQRARWLMEAIRTHLLDRVDLVYLESGSSTATAVDLWFLWQVRRRRLPLGIFVRDAYQRFGDLYPARTCKHRLLAWLYDLTLKSYQRWASVLFFPTRGLAEVVGGQRIALLPPGVGWRPAPPGLAKIPGEIIYVGANGPYDGVALALAAMPLVHQKLPGARLTLVIRPEEAPPGPLPQGVRVVFAYGETLSGYLWRAQLALIPRVLTRYNQIALPVKLMDYVAHGLPVVVTGPSEAAAWVVDAQVGVCVSDGAAAIAEGIIALLTNPDQLQAMAARTAEVASAHAWVLRARQVIVDLGQGRERRIKPDGLAREG